MCSRRCRSPRSRWGSIRYLESCRQTNSATAEESAAASQELSGQARVLKSLVQKFHLKENFCGRMGKAKQSAIFKFKIIKFCVHIPV